MTSTFTANLNLEEPANGDYAGDWQIPLNSNLSIVDQVIGTSTTVPLTSSNVTLTVAQAAFFQVICTGALTGNVQLIFPSTIGGRRVVFNQCTGAHTLTVLNGAGDTGGGVVVGQGYQTPILLTAGQAYYDTYGNTPPGAATLVSAATTDLGSVPQGTLAISGTTTIASFGSSAPVGTSKFLTFSGVLTLTYNATSLILPGAASITTAAGDTAIATQTSAGNWRVSFYQRASGLPLVVGAGVTSFNGRQNVVVPATGDYTTAELTTASTATAPSAGQLGETLTATGTSVSIGTTAQTNVCSVVLTAGHWLCMATACSVVNTSQVTTVYGGSISIASGSLGSGFYQFGGISIPANNTLGFSVPPLIVRTTGTTVYLGMYQGSSGGGAGTGTLTCLRID